MGAQLTSARYHPGDHGYYSFYRDVQASSQKHSYSHEVSEPNLDRETSSASHPSCISLHGQLAMGRAVSEIQVLVYRHPHEDVMFELNDGFSGCDASEINS